MHINVVIPTHDRWKLLKQTLKSLAKQTYEDYSVHVVVDGNPVMIPDWLRRPEIHLISLKDRGDVVAAYGHFTKRCESGAILNASDDLRFHPQCLSAAVYGLKKHFPKGMGVVGLNQLQEGLPRGRRYAFTLMNRRYVEHFPDRIIFCPDYVHYCSDMENGKFAQRRRCFFYCESAKVDHIRVKDMTTQLGLQEYKTDRDIYRIRTNKGLLWGQTFELIRRKG